MSHHSRRDFLRQLLRRVPMPVLAALFGLLTGAAVWIVIDPIQTRAIGNIFDEELSGQLETRASESLARFDSFTQSYVNTTRLLAHHRRMADYLEPVFWFSNDNDAPLLYREEAPVWLPEDAIKGLPVKPSLALLADLDGKIREVYQLGDKPLPKETAAELQHALASARQQAYITRLDGGLYVLISERVEDASYNQMGSLVLLISIDETFLNASQQRASTSQTTVALVDSESQTILASSRNTDLLDGANINALESDYVITAQSFFEYGNAPLNLLFATLISRDVIDATRQSIIAVERRHRLTGAAIVGLIFVLLFILISSRINRLLKRVAKFSSRALHIEHPTPRGGNQLLIMEDWIRSFTQAVMKAREEMRARYTAEIQEREALKTAVLDASLDPIVTIDQAGRIVDFNPTAEKIFGYSREEVLHQALEELIFDKGSREAFNSLLYDCLGEQAPESPTVLRTLSARRKDGKLFPVEVAIKPVMLENKLFFTTYIRDISERKRQAQEISSLAAFPGESPLPVLRINQPGVVIYANKASDALLEYWGCRRMQTVPIYWKRLVEQTLETGHSTEVEVETSAGVFSLLLAPVANLAYVNVYGRDITAIRQAEEEARHRQNELIHVSRLSTMGEMATGIAHELNQPLSAIVNFANGCARRIRLGMGEKEELIKAMEQISLQAERAGEIIKRLRGMVTRQQPVREHTDLNTLVKDACTLIAHDRQKLKIAIELQLSRQPVVARIDPVQIEQVILNLLRNSLDALGERREKGRRLLLETGLSARGMAYIRVQDNGIGIAMEDLKHLFDPFFSTKKTGMGMGLSISKTIVAEHNGRIMADSLPGKGTVFTIELPASSAIAESIAS
ncbi:PAS domain-containing sensor histidine kinase [Thiolapillus sp.]